MIDLLTRYLRGNVIDLQDAEHKEQATKASPTSSRRATEESMGAVTAGTFPRSYRWVTWSNGAIRCP